MQSQRCRTACLILSLSLPLVASCASTGSRLQTYPRAELLRVEPAPVPTVDIVNSAQANQAYQREKDAWGARGWAAVHGICTWAKERGMPAAPC